METGASIQSSGWNLTWTKKGSERDAGAERRVATVGRRRIRLSGFSFHHRRLWREAEREAERERRARLATRVSLK
jgi:hypothetical protein